MSMFSKKRLLIASLCLFSNQLMANNVFVVKPDFLIGGFVGFNAYSSFTTDGPETLQIARDVTAPVLIATNGQRLNPNFHSDPKGSRVYMEANREVAGKNFQTYIEWDWSDVLTNESQMNKLHSGVRHLYAQYGDCLIGQTWSNFMELKTWATVDPGGPVSFPLIRQMQFKITKKFDEHRLIFSIENPETVLLNNNAASSLDRITNPFREVFPDFTARYDFTNDKGIIGGTALVRNLSYRVSTTGVHDRTWGGAISLFTKLKAVGRDQIIGSFVAGNALGRYANNSFGDGAIADDGSIDKYWQRGGFLGYRHFWSDNTFSTVMGSVNRSNKSEYVTNGVSKSLATVHVNYFYNIGKFITLATEYVYGKHNKYDGTHGHMHRVMVAGRLRFFKEWSH